MKIVCIGGGPAGLYFALLMKQANPSHDITVVERNKPYDTFGWGEKPALYAMGMSARRSARSRARWKSRLPCRPVRSPARPDRWAVLKSASRPSSPPRRQG